MPDAGYTVVTSSRLQDAGENLITNATAIFTPLRPFIAGGVGGLVTTRGVATPVTNGVLTVTLADASLSNPQNAGYSLVITDNLSGDTILCVSKVVPEGLGWSLDSMNLPAAGGDVVTYGPVGMNFRGAFAANTAYGTRDAFTYGGSTYFVLAPFQAATFADIPASSVSVLAASGSVSSTDLANAATAADTVLRGGNLFDKTAVVAGYGVQSGDGTLGLLDFNYASSGFVFCHGAGMLITNLLFSGYATFGVAFYDAQKTYISGVTPAGGSSTLAVPSGATYMRFWWNVGTVGSLDTAMVVAGNTLPASYVPFGVPSTLGPLGRPSPQIGTSLATEVILRGGNLFDASQIVGDHTVSATDGSLQPNGGFDSSGLVYVKDAGQITTNIPIAGYPPTDSGYAFFDADKHFISSVTLNATIVYTLSVPAAAAYIRFWWNRSSLGTLTNAAMMLVAGAKLPSAYLATGVSAIEGPLGTDKPLSGLRLGIFGDSIEAYYNFSNDVAASLGMTRVMSDAVAGRGTNAIFQNTGTGAGLVSALANVDILVIELGTNDAYFIEMLSQYPVGTPASPSTESSFAGFAHSALQAILSVRPDIRIVWLTPYLVERIVGQAGSESLDYPNHYTNAFLINSFIPVLKGVCAQYGVPVIDMAAHSGINRYNVAHADGTPFVLHDHLHPTPYGYSQYLVPAIVNELPRFVLG